MTKDEALKLALEFIENSECGTADLEARIKEALAQPEQEHPAPCARHCEATAFQITIKNLKAQLEQRKPLTDEDIKRVWVSHRAAIPRYLCFARAIEAAHGIKENT